MLLTLFLFIGILSGTNSKEYKIKGEDINLLMNLPGEVKVIPGDTKILRISYVIPDSLKRFLKIKRIKNLYEFDFDIDFGELKIKKLKEFVKNFNFLVELPLDVSLNIDFTGGPIDGDFEFGGLTIRKMAISAGAGKLYISFDSPNRISMTKLELEAGAASIKIHKLGNSNLIKGKISTGVSSIHIDLGGQWKQKAEISLESAVANIQLSAPKDLKFNVKKEGFVTLGMKKRNVENPKFTLTINSVLGLVGFEEY